MLTEEALILLATLAAAGMLALGVMELVWPTGSRRAERRPRAPLPPLHSAFAPGGTRGASGSPDRDVVRARLGTPPLPVPDVPIRVVEPPDLTPPAHEEAAGGVRAGTDTIPVIEDREAAPDADRDAVVASTTVEPSDVAAELGGTADRHDAAMATMAMPAAVPEPTVTGEPLRDSTPPASSARPVEPATPLPAAPVRSRSERRRSVVAEPGRTVLPIETCLGMYNEHRYKEVVSLGSAALEVHARMAAVSHRPDEAAALQDLVGLARQELGDRDGARAAFGVAIESATAAARPTYIGHLLTLVRGVVDGVNVKDDDEIRVRELRACLAAIGRALDVASGDQSLIGARQAVLEAVGAICERLVPFALDDDPDPAAKALLLDVVADERMAGAWRDRLRKRLGASLVAGTTAVASANDAAEVSSASRTAVSPPAATTPALSTPALSTPALSTPALSTMDVGQLTVFAVRAVQEGREDEALAALERAEHLAAAMAGPDADERREELERRLWWGYTKVGLRRLESGTFDTALDPLFRALRLGRTDADRLTETRGALVRVLDGVAETTLPGLQARRQTEGAAAARETARVTSALQAWTAYGLTEQDLGEAHDRIIRLAQALV
jgi:hypothetical protein